MKKTIFTLIMIAACTVAVDAQSTANKIIKSKLQQLTYKVEKHSRNLEAQSKRMTTSNDVSTKEIPNMGPSERLKNAARIKPVKTNLPMPGDSVAVDPTKATKQTNHKARTPRKKRAK